MKKVDVETNSNCLLYRLVMAQASAAMFNLWVLRGLFQGLGTPREALRKVREYTEAAMEMVEAIERVYDDGDAEDTSDG